MIRKLRTLAGALVYDVVPFERNLRRNWVAVANRNEVFTRGGDGGLRPEWRFTSDLHIAKVFPTAGARLMRRSLRDWPIELREGPVTASETPEISFLIGHRGLARLPLLLQTLRSIAAQRDAAIECIVVEQSMTREIESALPPWVRYHHTPLPHADMPYSRAWTFNEAARLARGRVLVLHDNDILVPERYAAELARHVRGGAQFIDLKRFLFYLSERDTQNFDLATAVPEIVVQNLQGGSIAATRDAYFAIGGFDEGYVGWGGEDNDFWDRAAWYGGVYAFTYMPLVHLYHAPQPGKLAGASAPAVMRYREQERVPPEERVRRLLDQRPRE